MNKLGKYLKILLIIGFIIFIPCIIASPFLLEHTRKLIYSMIIIYPNGLLISVIVYQFIKIMLC